MYKNIVLAYDGSKFSNKALQEAIKLAKTSGGSLLLLSVVDITDEFEAQAPGLTDKMTEKLKKQAEKALEKALAEKIKAKAEVHVGDAYEMIVDISKKKKADIIVMGSHGRTGLTRLLMGSVTSKVIGHAPCSVLVVKT
ncbi:MAG: universal stress protein [Nitrospirota bacterium]|nr:universal stress protein [Nitrospirota bacterium]